MTKTFKEWMKFLEVSYQDEPLHASSHLDHLTVYFPDRIDLDNPDRRIDASLSIMQPPDWVVQIDEEQFLHELVAICVADSLHEILESIKIDGERPFRPHPIRQVHGVGEDSMWELLMILGNGVAKRLLEDHARA